jgi:hypothetical protein
MAERMWIVAETLIAGCLLQQNQNLDVGAHECHTGLHCGDATLESALI